ncbi:MAG: DUF998 domain-containing protein [Dehalococcoidales bacterium]|nr:MAG: DUF998 domain-containing protein [Dehalococcoidales bacterium]
MGVQTVHYYGSARLSRYLAICGMLAPLAAITCVLAGASVTPGYDHIRNTISELSAVGAPHPVWMNAGFISYGILMISLSFAVRQCLAPRSGTTIVWLMVVIHGVGVILAAVFPYNAAITEGIHSLEDIIHHLVSIIGCVAFIIAMLVMARMVSAEPAWRTVTRLSFAAIAIVSVLFVLSLIPIFEDVAGLLQKISALAMFIYIEALSIKCFTLSPDR